MPGRVELSFSLPEAADWETSPGHRAKKNLTLHVTGCHAHRICVLGAGFHSAVDGTVSSPDSHVEALTTTMTVLGERPLEALQIE